ncbi:MAG TPA: alpha-2-macroglobulin family protein [Chloroflexia bacterium]|nr:alpha-2-macroglobulin family protein [Chloroflexia bacterium]
MIRQPDFSRRRFLRLAGIVTGTTTLAPLLASCSSDIATPSPVPVSPTASQLTAVPVPSTLPPGVPVDSYLALAPSTMRSGQSERISVTLFNGSNLASSNVRLALLKDGQAVANISQMVNGRAEMALPLPKIAAGNYTLELETASFTAQSPVKVDQSLVLLAETDKPIYKPGQTVHIRILTLDNQLKPQPDSVTVEVMDAKGTKIFKKSVQADEYGMANVDMPLSSEPNLGVWKLTALAGKQQSQFDFRVEKYVLPKYEVTLNTKKDWALAGEKITGQIKAEYSYGKPVEGEYILKASRYTGKWEEYANVTRSLSGQADFELPAVGYAVGVPAAGGQGNLRLEVSVREKGTGYEESTSKLITVSSTGLTIKVIPESVIFKPGLPFNLLFIAETPAKEPLDTTVSVDIDYSRNPSGFNTHESGRVQVKQGVGTLQLNPPSDAISMRLTARASSNGDAYTNLMMQAGYSPTGHFIQLKQLSKGTLKVGDTAHFQVTSTKQANNFYYEVVARGLLVFTGFSALPDIEFTLTPQMTGGARLLVYQITPNSEVAADYLPFEVESSYPQAVQAAFDQAEVEPGQKVNLNLQTDGAARVGLAAVDRSVFILAENRLNLQQVFDELEKLYQKPQVELHEFKYSNTIDTFSSQEVIASAGMVVLTNKSVPKGQSYQSPTVAAGGVAFNEAMPAPMAAAAGATTAAATTAASGAARDAANKSDSGLAEVQRVRQYFPETWLWENLTTGADGKGSKSFTAPDSITTWMLQAVALSPRSGLGIAQAQLKVLQPFFVQADLVYSTIRGEEFPVKVALYNYTTQSEDFVVELDRANWFDLLEAESSKKITVGPNDVGGVSFSIRPKELGTRQLKLTARSRNRADAVIKDIIIDPEGVAREQVENLIINAGNSYELDMSLPAAIVGGSARSYLSLTGNYMTQTIEGLESLIRMPFGCGEQNMILFAPNVYVSQYLKETGQIKPELLAKSESLMITGYQREMTYRRNDGSFSAFGNSDPSGSLWLSAFVLKTFAQAKNFIYVDDAVLSTTRNWLTAQQKSDGSFEPVGFVHHQDLLGGLKGKTALTAYLAVALLESGDNAGAGKAISYLEKALPDINDVYSLALSAYALELAKSGQAGKAYDRLLAQAKADNDGLYWGDAPENPVPLNDNQNKPQPGIIAPPGNRSAVIETTGYALLALLAHGDRLSAGKAARWLVSRRNAYGGWDSTQDTVVGLQALAKYVAGGKADVDARLSFKVADGSWQKEMSINPDNADVLQMIDAPTGGKLQLVVTGRGQALVQSVRRYNVPDPERKEVSAFQLSVDYGTEQVAVNDQITVKVSAQFNPPEQIQAGMVVLDVALPTGFALVEDSVAALQKQQPKLKRFETAGRKVILYIEDMTPGEKLQMEFKAVALYPIKAQAVTSQAYSYYRPDWKGESLGGALLVKG